jgi:hypothetical protein
LLHVLESPAVATRLEKVRLKAYVLAQNALFEVLSTSGNEDTAWDALFLERNMLQDSTKDAGYFVWSIFNVFAIRRQRGSAAAAARGLPWPA